MNDQQLQQHSQDIKILVADDEPLMRTSLSRLLIAMGYQVQTACNGNEAIRHLESGAYDLILLDLVMPGLSGHEVMDLIQEKKIDTLIIVVSGETSIESAISGLRRGAYDFVRKPYEADEILKRVQNALASRRLEVENRDITERLRRSGQWYRYLVNNSLDIIYTLDPEGRFTFVNSAMKRMLGFTRKELLGKHYSCIVNDADAQGANHKFNERRTGERSIRGVELHLKRAEDKRLPGLKRTLPVELNSMGMYDGEEDKRRFLGTYGVVRDIADRKRVEKALAFQAYHDLLTGLPNRALFQDRLTQALNQAKRDHAQFAIMFIDLDKFKFVNDSLGHVAGDKLLKALVSSTGRRNASRQFIRWRTKSQSLSWSLIQT